ncbi:MAG: hypothetical protein GTN93_26055, partial [Anaerolineae bacterium]|nr:hypothetical protein [Anaerolineae bacterium]
KVIGGFVFAGAFMVYDQRLDQTSAGFPVVASGFKRYDLLALNSAGTVTIVSGTAVLAASPEFDGAPGFNLGPDLPDNILPLAYILVDEIA